MISIKQLMQNRDLFNNVIFDANLIIICGDFSTVL